MATSRAVAAIKRAKVVEAVAEGATYEQAAKRAGYATRSGAYKGFWKAVDGRQADAVDEHRMLEVQRLDALQVAVWDKAVAGDVKAVNAVLRIIEQRSRLLGLDKHTGVAAQSVVIDPAALVRVGEGNAGWGRVGGDGAMPGARGAVGAAQSHLLHQG